MMKHKRKIIGLMLTFGFIVLIFDSELAFQGANEGITLCLQTIVPSLFPFFLLSAALNGILGNSSFKGANFIAGILHIPPGAASLLIPAFLGGYPVGAKSVADLYKRSVVTKEEAERLLGFCNNAGPSFLFGVVASFFPDLSTVWLLWAIHIGSACLTALILSGNRERCSDGMTECGNHSNDIMLDSIKALCSVCGWVILFRVMITFFRAWFLWYFPEWIQVLIIGFLELSNGCCELMSVVNRNGRFIICAGMLAFGGLCVLLQTMSVTEGLSLRMYLKGKLLQTVFSVLVSCGIVMNHGYLLAVPVIPLLIVLRKNQKWYRKESCYPV